MDVDDQLALELAALHEAIASGSVPSGLPSADSRLSSLEESDSSLSAKSVLEMIERVRLSPHRSSALIGEQVRSVADSLPERVGRFQVRKLLGKGGFGLVFLAFDPQLDRNVAIKIPRIETLVSADALQRFMREGQAAASLNHVNIAPVFEVGNAGPISYIASAYCGGGSLAARMTDSSAPRIDFDSAAALIASLADAVQHAHGRGIVHRDLKPANILFDAESTDDQTDRLADPAKLAGAARIVDFGLAKSIHSTEDATRSGTMMGTLGYISPEQLIGDHQPLGPETDIYSLGAILYELLTGSRALKHASDIDTILAIKQDDPTPPHKIRHDCPRDLEAICLKCLEKSPAARYRAATHLADDLRRFIAGEPVTARSITSAEKAVRLCRRNPIVAGLSVAVFLLAISSTIAAALLARSRTDALRNLRTADLAKLESTKQAFEANLAHAHSARRTGLIGQRVESLRAIRSAVKGGNEFGISEQQRRELRNEAIASLSLFDLETERQWPAESAENSYPVTDRDCQQYVRVDGEDLLICDIESNQVLTRLSHNESIARYIRFAFSPDGKILAARFERTLQHERLQFWELASGNSLGAIDVGGFGNGSGFLSDSRTFALCGRRKKTIEVRELPSLKETRTVSLPNYAHSLAVHPTDPLVACYLEPSRIEFRHLESGELVRTLVADAYNYALGWSPDGRYFAATNRDGSVAVYDGSVNPKNDSQEPIWRRTEHSTMGVHLAWHPGSQVFVTSSMDGTSRLWDADTGSLLVTADGPATCFSDDGGWLGTARGRWRIVGGSEHRRLAQFDRAVHPMLNFGTAKRTGVTSEINHWEAFPLGRILIGQNFFGAVVRDVKTDQPLAEFPINGGALRFDPSGSLVVGMTTSGGLQQLPVVIHERDEFIEISIGPPKPIASVRPGMFAVGLKKTILHEPIFGRPQIIRFDDKVVQTVLTPAHRMAFFGDMSRNQCFVASGTFKGNNVQIHDMRSGAIIKTLPAGTSCPWFSTDNRILAVAEIGRYSFWETDSWQMLKEMHPVTRGIWPGSLAFTSDSRVVAIENGSAIELLDTQNFVPFAEFPVPSGETIESIRFSPDNRYLVVGGGDEGVTHLWDLKIVRQQLNDLGLDWDHQISALPNQLHETKPIKLNLDLGELANTGRD